MSSQKGSDCPPPAAVVGRLPKEIQDESQAQRRQRQCGLREPVELARYQPVSCEDDDLVFR